MLVVFVCSLSIFAGATAAFQICLDGFPRFNQHAKIFMQFSCIFSFCSSAHDHSKILWLDCFNDFLQAFSFFRRMNFPGNSNDIIKRSDYNETSGK